MGGACGMHEGEEKCMKHPIWKTREKRPSRISR